MFWKDFWLLLLNTMKWQTKIPCVVGFLLNFLFSNLPTLLGRVFLQFLSSVMILRMALLVTSFSTFLKGRLFRFFDGEFGEATRGDLDAFSAPATLFLPSSGLFLGPAELFWSPKSISKVSQPGFLTTFWTRNLSFLSE